MLCFIACSDGDIRLTGSSNSYEGTVEVCFENLWGLVSDSSWSLQDAMVVCHQLGYETQGTLETQLNPYKKYIVI